MAAYLDASALVALIAPEPASSAVSAWLSQYEGAVIVSDFARAETSTALARLRRIGVASQSETEAAYRQLDARIVELFEFEHIDETDIEFATLWVRQHDLALRAPDAIHIAAANRLAAILITLDVGMARAARSLNVACINPAESAA